MSSVLSDDGETFVHVQPLPVKSRKEEEKKSGTTTTERDGERRGLHV
jgi:hypothetical protein